MKKGFLNSTKEENKEEDTRTEGGSAAVLKERSPNNGQAEGIVNSSKNSDSNNVVGVKKVCGVEDGEVQGESLEIEELQLPQPKENGGSFGEREEHNSNNGISSTADSSAEADVDAEDRDDKRREAQKEPECRREPTPDSEPVHEIEKERCPSPPPILPVAPLPEFVGEPGPYAVSVQSDSATAEGAVSAVRFVVFEEGFEQEEDAGKRTAVGIPTSDCLKFAATISGLRSGRKHKIYTVMHPSRKDALLFANGLSIFPLFVSCVLSSVQIPDRSEFVKITLRI